MRTNETMIKKDKEENRYTKKNKEKARLKGRKGNEVARVRREMIRASLGDRGEGEDKW